MQTMEILVVIKAGRVVETQVPVGCRLTVRLHEPPPYEGSYVDHYYTSKEEEEE